jgi:hypothetical protein
MKTACIFKPLTIFVLMSATIAASAFDLQTYLKNLDKDPYAVMSTERALYRRVTNRLGELKTNSNLSEIPRSSPQTARHSILKQKISFREKVLSENLNTFSNPVHYDLASDLVDKYDPTGKSISLKTTVESLDSWKKSFLDEESKPWSGDYWATYRGIIAARYLDRDFMAIGHWTRARDYSLNQKPAASLLQRHLAGELNYNTVDQLSPSEKYELLVGDSSHALTRYNWSWGEGLQGPDGNIEDWMGICDGWASASIMLPRPTHAVSVNALDHDVPLVFYPADIMALASYLWAERSPWVKFIGGRCYAKNPRRDPESGRILDEDCFNTNPATWHVALLNQINQAQRSVIIDVFYDYEVWNQPVSGYRFRYFNPKTGESVNTLAEARVAYSDMGQEGDRKDIFAKFRKPSTFTHIVGVQMDLTYVGAVDASRLSPFTPVHDFHETITMVYDLELRYDSVDEAGNPIGEGEIVGGEWYSGQHPDFMWVPYENSIARGDNEASLVGDWAPTDARMPQAWRRTAVRNSRNGTPMNKILRSLIDRARATE